MIEYSYKFRIGYSETDKMGTVHHSKYPKYYESARWELFRHIGIPYKELENQGFLLPVISMNFKFIHTVKYDEVLTIKTTIADLNGVKLNITYRTYNSSNSLVNEGETLLAFVRSENFKPCAPPRSVVSAIQKYSNHANETPT